MIKRKNQNKTIRLVLTLIIVSLLFISITSFIYFKYKVVQIKYIPIDFEVGKVVGLTTDTDALHFGRIPSGGKALRQLNITNNFEHDVKINIKYYSNDMDWVIIKENGFYLTPSENKMVNIGIDVPINAIDKKYNATLKIIMLKV
jgi:hypothetical protein